ncbi:MAG: hypothetical protein GXP62_20455 [Oligoflexia bacterium]|nr:hypothetical protein [Oligoflexia bacterium]
MPLYGLVLETGAPGATWETLSVSGVGSRSFTIYAGEGLGPQIARREPDLIVVMLGGNEAGYPVLSVGDGSGYRPIFRAAVDLIRGGAPDAACLLISPLDQGEVVESTTEPTTQPTTQQGEPAPVQRRSKRGMPHLVAQQRAVAADAGCAFWSAYDAMGGEGAAIAWTRHRGMTTGDLVHLTGAGLAVIGNRLGDALFDAYDQWDAGAVPSQTQAPGH